MSSTQSMPSAARPGRASTGSGPPSSSLSTPPKITRATPGSSAAISSRAERERAAVVGRDDHGVASSSAAARATCAGETELGSTITWRRPAGARGRARRGRRRGPRARPARPAGHPAAGASARARSATPATTPCFQVSSASSSRGAGMRTRGSSSAGVVRRSASSSSAASLTSTPASLKPGQHTVAERPRVGGGLGGAPLGPRPVQQRGAAADLALELARDQLDLEDLGSVRDPLRLAQRHGVDRVSGRPVQLRGDVDHHRGGEHREVAMAVAAVLDGVAVDHRAERVAVAQVVEREADDRAVARLGHEPAVAVREPRADQVLDRVELERRPAQVAAVVAELHRRAVVEVGVHERAASRCAAIAPSALHRGLREVGVVVAARRLEGEVLAEVADRGDAGRERVDGVLQARGRADHEVAEVRLDRRGGDVAPVAVVEPRAGLLGGGGAPLGGHAHRAREAEPEAIERVLAEAVDDLVERARGRGPVAQPRCA